MHLLTLSRPDQVLPTIPWCHLEDATPICGASTDRDSGHLVTQTFTEARVSSNCAPSVFEGSNLVNNGCGRNHNGWVSVVFLRRYLVDLCFAPVFESTIRDNTLVFLKHGFYVQILCSDFMFRMFYVMFGFYVQILCSDFMFRFYVQILCSDFMFRIFYNMFRFYVQNLCWFPKS